MGQADTRKGLTGGSLTHYAYSLIRILGDFFVDSPAIIVRSELVPKCPHLIDFFAANIKYEQIPVNFLCFQQSALKPFRLSDFQYEAESL
jgi:hypothetical protein